MEIKVFDSYEEISKAASKIIINQVKNKPESILGLATGSSPLGIYKEMIQDHKGNNTTYQNITTFNLDEYYGIKKTHPKSYHYFMKKNLFNHIDIKKENINIPNGVSKEMDIECKEYNDKLEEHQIDIQLLGIGRNGHIGFNEPGTPFDSTTHQVKLDEKTRQDNERFFDSIEEVPHYAITMGIKNILQSKRIILIATGKCKADAVYGMIRGPIDINCPASSLQMHDDVTVFVDKAAASKL